MATKAEKQARQSTVTIGGKVYPLVYDYSALCELCDQLGATASNMQQVMASLPVSRMHLLLWAGMLDANPTVSPDDVKGLLKGMSIPDAQAVVMTAGEAFGAAMARPETGGDGKAAASPPTPATDPA